MNVDKVLVNAGNMSPKKRNNKLSYSDVLDGTGGKAMRSKL